MFWSFLQCNDANAENSIRMNRDLFFLPKAKGERLTGTSSTFCPNSYEPVVITRAPQHSGLQARSPRRARTASRARRQSGPAGRAGMQGHQPRAGKRSRRGGASSPHGRRPPRGSEGYQLLLVTRSCVGSPSEARGRRCQPGKQRGRRGAAAAGSGGGMSDAETAGAANPVTCATHASLTAGTGTEPSATAVRSRPARFPEERQEAVRGGGAAAPPGTARARGKDGAAMRASGNRSLLPLPLLLPVSTPAPAAG